MTDSNNQLQNYHTLVTKVDSLCAGIVEQCRDSISCQKGCDECCRHFSIFWVEAVNLAIVVANLPQKQADFLRSRARKVSDQDGCPLLVDGACALYSARPIICRTHGLPILIRSRTTQTVDFCPRNFTQAETIPGKAIIDLDVLNNSLAAINALFVSRYFNGNPPSAERLAIADALLLKI
ncbi:MAG: YkgJ family cysteine cluster protein [Geobacteraceae bacterium]